MSIIVECNCGEVSVHFATTKPLFRLVCCCADCNAILQWAASKRGHCFYPAHQGIDKLYLENSLRVVKGEENLRWVKITSDTVCLRSVTTCCYSSLFVENLSILGAKIVCIDIDFCKVRGNDYCGVTAQIFERDVPANRTKAVCDGFEGPRFDAGPENTPSWPNVIPTLVRAQTKDIVVPEGFGSIRDVIETSVRERGFIYLDGYNERATVPIDLSGSD